MYDALAEAVKALRREQAAKGPGHSPSAEYLEGMEVATSLLHEFERGGIRLDHLGRSKISRLSHKARAACGAGLCTTGGDGTQLPGFYVLCCRPCELKVM